MVSRFLISFRYLFGALAMTAVLLSGPAVSRPDVGADIGDDDKIVSELECLALNVYWEARSEPYRGQLAVAAVTL